MLCCKDLPKCQNNPVACPEMAFHRCAGGRSLGHGYWQGNNKLGWRDYAVSAGGKPDDNAFRIAARKAASAARAACHRIRFRFILRPSSIECRAKCRVSHEASEDVLRGYVSLRNSCVVIDNFLIPTQGDFIELRAIPALMMGGKIAVFYDIFQFLI